MTNFHREAEAAALQADTLAQAGDWASAKEFYAHAASVEEQTYRDLAHLDRPRTRGIIGVSVVALYYKAGQYRRAELLALSMLQDESLPAFAHEQLRDLLSDIWSHQKSPEHTV